MNDYEIDAVVESVINDMDFYDYDDYAMESFASARADVQISRIKYMAREARDTGDKRWIKKKIKDLHYIKKRAKQPNVVRVCDESISMLEATLKKLEKPKKKKFSSNDLWDY